MIKETKEKIEQYLLGNKWKKEEKDNRNILFYKKRTPENSSELKFLEYSKKLVPVLISEIYSNAKKYFKSKGFSNKNLGTVINSNPKDPLFVSAAIQYFSDYFHGKDQIQQGNYFIDQPVIRTQTRNYLGEGKISSFVNIATTNCDSSPESHIRSIDYWMNFISSTGLFISDFNLLLKPKKKAKGFWSSAKGFTLKFNYGGLEIGTAGALILDSKKDKMISDIGFGLERLTWAINKNKDFFDIIGPKPHSFSTDDNTLDALRTTTLMGLSGISTKDSDKYRQFKSYIKNISFNEKGISEMINHYFDYWNQFMPAKRDLDKTKKIISSEINKQRNGNLLKKLGYDANSKKLSSKINMGQDSFIEYLIVNKLTNLKKIREVLK